MTDQGFLDEIAATPDDPAPYLIYSDALQLRGDPRGELIAIQHALETAAPAVAADLRRREAELIENNREAWLGPLLDHRDALAVRWRFGFLHAARVEEDVDALHALLATSATPSTLAELHVGPHSGGDEESWPSCQPIVDALKWRPALQRLHVSDVDLYGIHLAAPVRLPPRAKQLDALVVQSRAVTLDWDASPAQLRHLEIRSLHVDASALARCAWPKLESLVVWTPDASEILHALTRMPRLRHLGLCGTTKTDALVRELAQHPIAPQLASLDLRGGTLTSQRIARRAFAKHVRLDLRFTGKRPLTDADQLVTVMVRMRGKCYEDAPGSDGAKAFHDKHLAATPDPYWLLDGRQYLAERMKPHEKRDVLAQLTRECEAMPVPPGERTAVDVYYELGQISDALVEGFEAEVWLWKAVLAARWSGHARAEIEALGLIGTTRMRRGDPVHAAAILDRVLAYYLAHGKASEQAWALRQRGNADLVRSAYATAEGFYRRALAIYVEREDQDNQSIVLSELAGVLWSRQDFEGAVAMIRESIAMRRPDSLGLASAHYNLGAVLNGMGRVAEAEDAARRALAIFRNHRRRDGEGQALSLLGELAQRTHRHDEAQHLLEEALACHRERGAVRETGITLGNLARVALDRAAYDLARRHAEEAVELHRTCGNKYNEGLQLLDAADAAIGERRLDDALALTEEALVPLLAIESLPALAAAKCRRGYIAQLRGDFAAAERHYDGAIADTTRGNYPEQIGWTQLYRAVIRARQGRSAEARALLDEARGYLAASVQGLHALAVTEAVIAGTPPPPALCFDARLIASFAT